MENPNPNLPIEPPNIRADFYAGPWDGTTVYFSGAYPTYTPIIPVKDDHGTVIHREKALYRLDASRTYLPLLYRYVSSERIEEKPE